MEVRSFGRSPARLRRLHQRHAERRRHPTLNVLLVDSEEALAPEPPPAETESQEEKRQRERSNARVRRDHLASRDGWDLSDVEPEQIHLMVPCMEAWIAADPDGMALYYGQGFRLKSLPRRLNLEDEPKANLYSKLANATKDTSKGEYSESNNAKIRHASSNSRRAIFALKTRLF
ncbi:MAG: DUF4276 family protein [Isosphaeraceae bacterium]